MNMNFIKHKTMYIAYTSQVTYQKYSKKFTIINIV